MLPPCSVPVPLRVHFPSSSTPAANQRLISRTTRSSPIRRSTNATSFAWSSDPKKLRRSASSTHSIGLVIKPPSPPPRAPFSLPPRHPAPDHPHHALVPNPPFYECHQLRLVQRSEEVAEIGVEHPLYRLGHQTTIQRRQRVMCAAPWPRAVREAGKLGLAGPGEAGG